MSRKLMSRVTHLSSPNLLIVMPVSCTKGQYVYDESCHAYERVQVLCVVQERVAVRASGLGFGSSGV